MPLIALGQGKVKYIKPSLDEMPNIGRLVCLNETVQQHKRDKYIRELSDSMSRLQIHLLGKNYS